jgi:hypothetical protein
MLSYELIRGAFNVKETTTKLEFIDGSRGNRIPHACVSFAWRMSKNKTENVLEF